VYRLARSSNGLVVQGIYLYITISLGALILMQNRITDHKRRVARLNRYVAVVAILWLVASFALLFLSGSGHERMARPIAPAQNTMVAAATVSHCIRA
jgi:hypothetical protein